MTQPEVPGTAAGPPAERRWRFGPAVFDESNLELRVNGAAVALEKKSLEVLRHLLLNASKLVTKDDLLKAVWPGRILTETVITKTVGRLRDALGDTDQTLIKTVHGYGYRLIVPVERDAAGAPAPPPPDREPAAPFEAPVAPRDAERRQVTVMFCDLAGSTQLARELDAEDYRELLLQYQHTVAGIVERYEGHVAQYLGDGLLVYFGHPVAHDDDAERAVRAAFDIVQALKRDGGDPLRVRVGIHSGIAILGAVGRAGQPESLALGDTINLASRLQTAAEPGTVIVSEATHRLVPGLFITKDLGPLSLKGFDPPVRAHRIVQPSGVRGRLEAAAGRLTPFVGREQELSLLGDRWQRAQDGQGQAMLLSADAGMGKSRLAQTFHERLHGTAHTRMECRCSPLSSHSAFHPVIELLHRGLALKEGDPPDTALKRLEEALDRAGLDRSETVPLLAPLLHLPLPPGYAPSPFGPELKRRKTLESLAGWLLALARQQPLLLAFEDLHWADPSTVDLLTVLLEQVPTHAVMVLMTARPEFASPWLHRTHVTVLSLQPLRTPETSSMLDSLTRERRLPEPVRQRLMQQANGVPLFLEEITKSMLESGQLAEGEGGLQFTGDLESLAIPATLQDSLMARLDRLGEARPLIQLCAAIGREIPFRLLEAVADPDESGLRRHLQKLCDAQLLYPRGAPPEGSHIFKHALIQDTAYNTLLKPARQKLHGKIAAALESTFADRVKREPELLAGHFEKAGQPGAAVRYYKLAADGAMQRLAGREAITYAERALGLLRTLPAGDAVRGLELELLLVLGMSRSIAKGYGHPEVQQVMAEAARLLTDAHDPGLRIRALYYLCASHYVSGKVAQVIEASQQMVRIGAAIKVPIVEGSGQLWLGLCYSAQGRISDAEHAVESTLGPIDLASSRSFAATMNRDPVTGSLATLGWTRWLSGYPDQALARTQEAVARAQAVGNPIVICLAQAYGLTSVLMFRREAQALLSTSRETIALCERYGDGQWRTDALKKKYVAMCLLGQTEEGLAGFREVLKALRSVWSLITLPIDYGYFAEMCLLAGRHDEAREALAEAFRMASEHGLALWDAELHRLKGEVLLAGGAPDLAAAEASFQRAIGLSREKGARSFELRAATSLARLWRKQRRGADARDLLRPVHGWFTEGFDTPDLRDAEALLSELEAR